MFIVALDFDGEREALRLVRRLKPLTSHFKVGLGLFSRHGLGIVRALKGENCKVFLDLKYHDIPATVLSAVKSAVEAGVWMFNVHALGGYRMMKATAEFTAEYAERLGVERPLVVAVTILTSMDRQDLKVIGIEESVEDEVLRLAELAKKAGLDGVVCSARWVARIKRELGESFITVTPGIRLHRAVEDDQKRAVAPSEAVAAGADYLVVGRPVTKARDPYMDLKNMISEVAG